MHYFWKGGAAVPWSVLCGVIELCDPKAGHGRPPAGMERMPRFTSCNSGSTFKRLLKKSSKGRPARTEVHAGSHK